MELYSPSQQYRRSVPLHIKLSFKFLSIMFKWIMIVIYFSHFLPVLLIGEREDFLNSLSQYESSTNTFSNSCFLRLLVWEAIWIHNPLAYALWERHNNFLEEAESALRWKTSCRWVEMSETVSGFFLRKKKKFNLQRGATCYVISVCEGQLNWSTVRPCYETYTR